MSGVYETMPWPSFLSGSGIQNAEQRKQAGEARRGELGRYLYAGEVAAFSITISSVEVNP